MATLVHYNRLETLRRAFDPFGDFFQEPVELSNLSDAHTFKMNVEDKGTSYEVTAELAGVKREDIDVELNEGRLSIAVTKQESEEDKHKNYLYKETSSWSATRGVYLKDAATQGLSARLANGVLTITVPKQQEKANVTKVSID